MLARLPAFAGVPREGEIYHCDAMTLLKALPDDSVDLILTDPPYGVTAMAWDIAPDLTKWWSNAKRVIKPTGVIVCTATEPFASKVRLSWIEGYKYEWVWIKEQGTMPMNAPYRPIGVTEYVLVFSHAASTHSQNPMMYNPQMNSGKPFKSGKKTPGKMHFHSNQQFSYTNTGTRYPQNVLRFNTERGLHPTQKPVALFEYLIKTYTHEGYLVVDPFMGSGTTAVAARNVGRRFVGCDLSHEYVTMARERLAKSDPYVATEFENGHKQLSLFEGMA